MELIKCFILHKYSNFGEIERFFFIWLIKFAVEFLLFSCIIVLEIILYAKNLKLKKVHRKVFKAGSFHYRNTCIKTYTSFILFRSKRDNDMYKNNYLDNVH